MVPFSARSSRRPYLDREGRLRNSALMVRYPGPTALDRPCAMVALLLRPAVAAQWNCLLHPTVCNSSVGANRSADVGSVSQCVFDRDSVSVAALSDRGKLDSLQRFTASVLLHYRFHRRAGGNNHGP